MAIIRGITRCYGDFEAKVEDEDRQSKMVEYNGVEACMLKNQCYENECGGSTESYVTDTVEDERTSCSSSKDDSGSFCSEWMVKKKNEQQLDEWEFIQMHDPSCIKEKKAYVVRCSDVGIMKEKFAKLLLGEDVSGGSKGLSTAVALSNSITSLAASTFGEMWKLQPLPQDRRIRWHKEMDWLLSPTKSMVELVPAKQNGVNGGLLEIMVPRARKDIQMNLPALQKLDSMIIDTLDAMENTEFWYDESRTCGGRTRERWCMPSPRVPDSGLSPISKKTMHSHAKVVSQIFKAAKSINQSVLEEMHIPSFITEALPRSGKACLGEELHKAVVSSSIPVEQVLNLVQPDDEHRVLEAINRLEAAAFQWKERREELVCGNVRSQMRTSWPLLRDPEAEVRRVRRLLTRAQDLIFFLHSRHPNLPQSFLEGSKVQYSKDVGCSILESYSRALSGVSFNILARIVDVMRRDSLRNSDSEFGMDCCCYYSGLCLVRGEMCDRGVTGGNYEEDDDGSEGITTKKLQFRGGMMSCVLREACCNKPYA